VLEVKMAKATEDDFRCVTDFLTMLDEIVEYGTYTPPNEDEEEISEEIDAERLRELIDAAWGGPGRSGVGSSWRRVVWGGKMLVDNCCDPDADVLEWRPDVKAYLESQETDHTPV
jgi:hypothetical protein